MSGILAALHLQQHIGMITTIFPAAKLLSAQRIELAIQAMAGAANVSHLAAENEVSRKFIYEQKTKARDALNNAFASASADDAVLFSLPVTKEWLHQVVLALTLICHSSYRGVVEFMRDILGVSISVGSVHNLHQEAAQRAADINQTQDLSQIRVGLHDEIFHCNALSWSVLMPTPPTAIYSLLHSTAMPIPGPFTCCTLVTKDSTLTTWSLIRARDCVRVKPLSGRTSPAMAMCFTFCSSARA